MYMYNKHQGSTLMTLTELSFSNFPRLVILHDELIILTVTYVILMFLCTSSIHNVHFYITRII